MKKYATSSKPFASKGHEGMNRKAGIVVEVRKNNVDKALRILKKKLQEDGLFNELRERESFMSKGERKRRARAAGQRREKKKLETRLAEQGF